MLSLRDKVNTKFNEIQVDNKTEESVCFTLKLEKSSSLDLNPGSL